MKFFSFFKRQEKVVFYISPVLNYSKENAKFDTILIFTYELFGISFFKLFNKFSLFRSPSSFAYLIQFKFNEGNSFLI